MEALSAYLYTHTQQAGLLLCNLGVYQRRFIVGWYADDFDLVQSG